MYAKIDNGNVIQVGLPTSGCLYDGSSVSNYNLLPDSVLLAEGWLPLIENKPEFNPETQGLRLTGYTIEETQVVANYVIVTKLPTVEERLDATEAVLMDVLETIMTL
jgi:hypothetical protein